MVQGGVEYDLAFLRPVSWLEATGAKVGGSIHMELHEMGLDGLAKVVGIDACPQIEADDGTGRNVVTGRMAHAGANILYLDITGLDEPLGVTDTHPIWSETRQDFVVAGQLEVGEQFRTLTGESATLTKIHPHRGPPEMVFNLEVDAQHVYSVAGNGLLVHNACSSTSGHSPAAAHGQEMHKAYKLGLDDQLNTFKEFVIPGTRKKIDFLDVANGVIYELKPNNPRAISRGLRQAGGYANLLSQLPEYANKVWKVVIDVY